MKEKLIKALTCCLSIDTHSPINMCSKCPFFTKDIDTDCVKKLMKATLDYLEELPSKKSIFTRFKRARNRVKDKE